MNDLRLYFFLLLPSPISDALFFPFFFLPEEGIFCGGAPLRKETAGAFPDPPIAPITRAAAHAIDPANRHID